MHAFWNVWDFFAPVDYIPIGCAAFILILLAPEWISALREAYVWAHDLLVERISALKNTYVWCRDLLVQWIGALRDAYRWCRDLLCDEPSYFKVTDYGWHLSDDHKAARREFDREMHAYDFRHFAEPTTELSDQERANELKLVVGRRVS